MGLVFRLLFKDLRDMLATQTALLILLTPVALAWILGRTARPNDLRKIVFAVTAPPDCGLVRVMQSKDGFELLEVAEGEGPKLVERREVVAHLIVPEGFDDDLQRNKNPQLTLLTDEAFPTQVTVLRETLRSAVRDQAGQEIPADIRMTIHGRKVGAELQTLSLMVLFAVIASLAVSASSMTEEKEAGTLQQILMTPATLPQVILGKVAAGSVLAGTSALLVLVLNAPKDASWSGLLVLLAVGVVAFSSVGALVGILAEGATAANAWAGLLFLALFVPVSLAETSRTMSSIVVWSPAYYLHDGFQRSLAGGATLVGLAPHLGVLLLATVATVGISSYRLKRMSL